MADLIQPSPSAAAHRLVREGDLVRCGSEVAALAERFYLGLFTGTVILVGVAALAALILFPLRGGGAGSSSIAGILVAGSLVLGTPVAVRESQVLYRALRRRMWTDVVVLVLAIVLVVAVLPLRSQFWWPSCALLMLLALTLSIGQVLTACVALLVANLTAHLVVGDLGRAPAVSILGLWIGYIFWTSLVAGVTNKLGAYLLRLNEMPSAGSRAIPLRVTAWIPGEPAESEDALMGGADASPSPAGFGKTDLVGPQASEVRASSADVEGARDRLDALTARQLEVVALLADGLRYREIAACLSISEGQVQRHVARAVRRLCAGGATELVALAVRAGMVRHRTARVFSPTGPDEAVLGEADAVQN